MPGYQRSTNVNGNNYWSRVYSDGNRTRSGYQGFDDNIPRGDFHHHDNPWQYPEDDSRKHPPQHRHDDGREASRMPSQWKQRGFSTIQVVGLVLISTLIVSCVAYGVITFMVLK